MADKGLAAINTAIMVLEKLFTMVVALKVLKGATVVTAALSSCQALSAARSIIQSWVLVNVFCQAVELRGSSGAPVVLTDTVACHTLYAWRAVGALQRLTLRPTCDFRLTGSLPRVVIVFVCGGVAQQPSEDGGRRVASFRT